ncbi:MAG: penicillin-binding protein 1C [Methylotenera sp.]|nr:penicillin-binding protein 1C [Methylotenera sp.]
MRRVGNLLPTRFVRSIYAWATSCPPYKSRHLKYWLILLALVSIILVALRLYPKPALADLIPHSTAIYAADGTLLRLTLAQDAQYQLWVPLKNIEPNAVEAVKLYEDRYFMWHFGVNPVALVRGMVRTYSGSSRQGASTITMQLARALYGIDSRSVLGKIEQIFAAFWLECRYSKQEILEAYLNIAPYGGNIKGIATASLFYFNKPASRLTLPEAITLAVIPQNPNKRLYLSAQNTMLKNARQRLWEAWLKQYPHDSQYAADMALPVQTIQANKNVPFLSPHFTDALMQANPRQAKIQTGLNLHAQATLQRMIDSYVQNNQSLGINNVVAMLYDAKNMQVKALVGSANYYNSDIDGQVNGASAKRSPGSTLKPFIYGLALDQSLIHPASILKDAPTSFGPYSPENFDGRFIGPITATDALIRSRNVPAVALSSKLSQPSLYDFLKNAGVRDLKSERHYGLALALGGGELSMEELVSLYAMLANHGRFKPFSLLKSDVPAIPLLSEESAYIVLDMLRQNPRPDTGEPDRFKTAWKTGTSWGFHDAWTIGVSGNHVLAVWVGNFDGKPNPAFVGIKTAAPLFFQIMDSLRHQKLLSPQSEVEAMPPRTLTKVNVCTASGDLPNQYCKNLSETWFIPGKSPIKVSTLHRPVYFDNTTNQAVCQAGANTHEEIIEFWDADMLRLFREAGMPRRTPPKSPAECNQNLNQNVTDTPQITSPLRGVSYTISISKPETIALRANKGGLGAIYWFADNSFIGKSEAGAGIAWTPPHTGTYVLRAVDEHGRADSREVAVEFID